MKDKAMLQKGRWHPSEKGSISLLALLIMLAIAGIGLSVSIIILGELESTQDFASSMEAYYAAETGLERGLHIIKENRTQKNITVQQTLQDVQEDITSDSISETFDQNGARYDVVLASNNEVDAIQFHLAKEQTQQIDMYDPDTPMTRANNESVQISWHDTCNGLSWIELSAVEWAESWTETDAGNSSIEKFFYSCHFSNTAPPAAANECLAVSNVLDTTKSYNVRIRNIGECDIQNAEVKAFAQDNAGGDPSAFESQIAIQVEGVKGRTKQTLSTHLPWQAPASALLDFVLFSEAPLRK